MDTADPDGPPRSRAMNHPATEGPRSTPVEVVEVVEVPLFGPAGPGTDPAGEPVPDERPNRRRTVALGLAGAAAVAIVTTILVRTDDDPAEASPTTLPADALSAQITTPPTLRPLDTLPLPDDPALGRNSLDEGPQPTTSQDWDLFSGVTVPTYPRVTDVGLADLVEFDIAGAVARLGEDLPRRSETRLELGTAGFVLDVVIEREPERDRYRVELTSGDDVNTLLVDAPGDRTVVVRPDGQAFELTIDELLEETDAPSVRELFDPLLLGPLRPDSYAPVATRGRQLVTIDDTRVAREFVTVIRGALIPEWQLYAFSPVFEFPVEDRPSTLEYLAYVSEDGDIIQINGLAQVGDVPQLVLHRIIQPDEPIVIDLPPPLDEEAATESSTPMTPPPPGN